MISARAARTIAVAVAVLALSVDILTKWLAVQFLDPLRPVPVIDGLLTLRLIRNPGAAFSIGEDFTPVFSILAAGALIGVSYWAMPKLRHRGWAVTIGLLLAGIAGNFLDRLFREPGFMRGHVVDFLQLPNWPIFNFADMCIDAAAVLIIWFGIVRHLGLDGQPNK